MEFKLKWLNSEEFDRLPYKKAPTALGLADKNTGDVYIRDTGNVALDTFSVYHELEHLKGNDHGEHEDPDEQGIYYKNLKSVFVKPIQQLMSASINNPIADTLFGGLNRSLPGGKKPQQPQMQQSQGSWSGLINQIFTPQAMSPQSPAVSQVGGGDGGNISGSDAGTQGTIDKIRQFMASRQKGNYVGGPQ